MDRYDENHQRYTSDPRFPAVEAKAKAKAAASTANNPFGQVRPKAA